MKLYSYFRSSSAYRVRIALNHKQIPYEYIPVHLLKDGGEQKTSAYGKINSKHEVPVLEDKNVRLSQSVAIFLYLDRANLNNPLFPKAFPDFEKCFELVELINSGIQPLQNLAVLKKLKKDFEINDEQKVQWIKDIIRNGLLAYSKKISDEGPYSMGTELTAADMFLIPQLYNAHRYEIDFTGLEKLLQIERTCLMLDSFKTAHPDIQPDSV